MGFPDALKLALHGATIARSSWPQRCSVKLEERVVTFRSGHPGSRPAPFWAGPEEMQALDWEVVR